MEKLLEEHICEWRTLWFLILANNRKNLLFLYDLWNVIFNIALLWFFVPELIFWLGQPVYNFCYSNFSSDNDSIRKIGIGSKEVSVIKVTVLQFLRETAKTEVNNMVS